MAGQVHMLVGAGGNIGVFTGADGVFLVDDLLRYFHHYCVDDTDNNSTEKACVRYSAIACTPILALVSVCPLDIRVCFFWNPFLMVTISAHPHHRSPPGR